jgi:hypothetical protein
MQINYMMIFVATILQFILGALWYSPLIFGKLWMQIMEVTHISKEELSKMQKEMGPFYALQFFITFFSTFSFATLTPFVPAFSTYHLAFWLWIGFIVPVQIGSVIWGNTKKKFWAKQLFVITSYQLIALMIIAFVLS